MHAIPEARIAEENTYVETTTNFSIYTDEKTNLTIATENKGVCLGIGFTPFSCF